MSSGFIFLAGVAVGGMLSVVALIRQDICIAKLKAQLARLEADRDCLD